MAAHRSGALVRPVELLLEAEREAARRAWPDVKLPKGPDRPPIDRARAFALAHVVAEPAEAAALPPAIRQAIAEVLPSAQRGLFDRCDARIAEAYAALATEAQEAIIELERGDRELIREVLNAYPELRPEADDVPADFGVTRTIDIAARARAGAAA